MTAPRLAGWPRRVWRVLRLPLLGLAALWFLFEEFAWRPLARATGRLARWPPWARTEARIARLPPRRALFLFMVPVVVLFPFKLLALDLMSTGRPGLGLLVILAAKLVGTATGGRLYLLMRPQLLTIRRFARFLAWWRFVRMTIKRYLRTAAHVRAWRAIRQRLRAWWG